MTAAVTLMSHLQSETHYHVDRYRGEGADVTQNARDTPQAHEKSLPNEKPDIEQVLYRELEEHAHLEWQRRAQWIGCYSFDTNNREVH